MRPDPRCQVNAAIERALADGASAYDARGVIVTTSLDATTRLSTEEPVLDQSLYTIFRGIPERLAPGATLLISTRDRAGGDIELTWEARELDKPPARARAAASPLARGPYGDLLELALLGLEAFCHVRSHHEESPVDKHGASNYLQLAPHVRRRYMFLIPSLRRQARDPRAGMGGAPPTT